MTETLLLTILLYLALGICAGMLSGLLGAGGGLVMVPGLMLAFRWEHINPAVQMHVAVSTSLAAMIPVTFRSLLSHMKKKIPFFHIYKQLAPAMIVGVIGGSILAHFIHSTILQILFGLFVLLMAIDLLRQKKSNNVTAKLPGKLGMSLAGGFVGLQSSFFGLGGASFTVPFLSRRGVNMHTVVIVAVAVAMSCAILGTVTFMITGMHATGLPHWHIGYVYWPAWLGLAIGGVFIAPLGAKISHLISPRKLQICFALFLLCVSAHMLWV